MFGDFVVVYNELKNDFTGRLNFDFVGMQIYETCAACEKRGPLFRTHFKLFLN